MKKLISILLAFAMLLSVLTAMVSASGKNPFTDVKESDYYYEPVLWAVENGITTGTSATTFSPDSPCTRAQVVTFLWRSAGSPEPAKTENPFKDVAAGAYYYKAVLWAVEKGITTGTSATTFGPDSPCTRAQVVTFLWRADGSTAPNKTDHSFKDIAANAYYYNAVLWAVEKGITTGLSANAFGPDATCIRAQIVTFLYRYMSNREDLSIVFQPENYYMGSSMETADFLVQVKGGTAPYTFRWVVAYDDVEVCADPVTATSPIHVFSKSFSDYDFDEYDAIVVYCIIEDAAGARVHSMPARVYPYFAISTAPPAHQMTSSSETVDFSIQVTGGTAPYTYEWVLCYGSEEVWVQPEVSNKLTSSFSQLFTDYDFDDHSNVGVYCRVTDANGQELTSDIAEVYPYVSMRILTQPADYQMTSSSETAEFSVEIDGGLGAYTYQWVICYDNEEVWPQPELSHDTSSIFSHEFTDYDFDDHHNIGVYCIITDATGREVTSSMGNVYPKG